MQALKNLSIVLFFSSFSVLFAQKPQFSDLLQNIDSREKVSLNGLWDIIIDPLENGYYNHRLQPMDNGFFKNAKMQSPSDLIEYNFDTSDQIMVPGDWNSQMEKLYYFEGTVWYKKDFNYTPTAKELVYLYFEAVNYEAIVYLNGERIGTHTGGYTPFQFEVTDKLKKGNNFVVVKVDNKRKRENVPTVNQDWWNYGGITRSVHLISTPVTHISDYSIQLAKGSTTTIEGWVNVENAVNGERVEISIPELRKTIHSVIENGTAHFSIKAKPKLWEPNDPKLYEVSIKTTTDKLTDAIGFRTISTQGSKIVLNGKEVFLKGISIHEEAPFKTGRVTTKEECRILLQWAKELGCNYIRLAHYPHSETMVREAEKMGFMIWSEIPVYWTILFDNTDTYANAKNQLTEMISRDKNRAAILMWSVANETPESDARLEFLGNLAEEARKLDPTRLITAALDTQSEGENGKLIEDPLGKAVDVIGINHYCGWYVDEPENCSSLKWASAYDKPMVMSEVGGGALYGLHGEKNERWTEEYQAHLYKTNIEMMRNIDFLSGLSPWILMDFRSSRRPLKRIQEDFNRKGLISEQGMKKQAFYILRDYYLKENN
ncbi:glycoside hydrolase family 2 protein [Maribacter polysaccharolyticus]|uniref:glycoside hydrolase family 2 protein n=1 Tax=Maribacter polysaccharolyticus TaxID=3020831 RepID=UPI00237FC8F9|nr:glycoside hydrolase family 2 TIM barrel-domain containing protein [Maribacter polysaccharolyticus]MDE3742428.1 glycoside hydrolase family 2 TIM barrel-domain containing protein [Maribacter polysaccharolyticus]